MAARPEEKLIETIDRQPWLEALSKTVQEAVQKLYSAGGPAAMRVRDFLHGVWLGHPLHAVLTDVTIGAYLFGMAFDLLEMAGVRLAGRRSGPAGAARSVLARAGAEISPAGQAADTVLQIGAASAGLTALTGVTDWQHTIGSARRVGMAHALLNSGALAFILLSLLARKGGQRSQGRALAFGGYLLSLGAAYLGGHLAYGYRIGMNHAPVDGLPAEYKPVIAETELPDGRPVKAWMDEIPLVLVRRGGQVFALADRCAHMGGPLSEGQFHEDRSITCPWHCSTFSMEDGRVLQGPSVYTQPCFETRILNGQVEVRLKSNSNVRSVSEQ
ncbi:MAG: Rieske 2Fe-2S domain-containing protein [Chloroflexota bacterium]